MLDGCRLASCAGPQIAYRLVCKGCGGVHRLQSRCIAACISLEDAPICSSAQIVTLATEKVSALLRSTPSSRSTMSAIVFHMISRRSDIVRECQLDLLAIAGTSSDLVACRGHILPKRRRLWTMATEVPLAKARMAFTDSAFGLVLLAWAWEPSAP